MSGALVVSIDFEKRWGVREGALHGPYRANILGVPASVRGTLALFSEFEIAATWSTVGFLLARSRAEREHFNPKIRPAYRDKSLDPYGDITGENEAEDPLHFGASLIPEILETPRQELSTHTYSHFYCLADGVTADAFAADLESARAIMGAVAGVEPRSIVFPRNEHNPAFDGVLKAAGITCYRGNPSTWMWKPGAAGVFTRAARLADAYVPVGGLHTVRWQDIPQPNGTSNVAASAFVRPNSAGARLRRIIHSMRWAAEHGEVVHLWWHPHNFGVRTAENLLVVRAILDEFRRLRARYGMRSMNMMEAADEARRLATAVARAPTDVNPYAFVPTAHQ